MTLLSGHDIEFSYHQRPVLANISLTVPEGELVGIVGPNGSGKSTLLKLLAHQEPLRHGRIELKQRPLTDYGTRELARELAFLPQRPLIPAGIRVAQLVQYGRHPHQGWLSQWSEEDRQQVAAACEAMQLEDLLHRPVSDLSGGQAQRVWLAMILAQNTDLVLLDEPTSALDIGHQTEVMEAIHRMTASGKTVLIVLHDLAMAARYCDRLLALADGSIAAAGPPREVITKPLIDRLYQTDVDILQAPGDGAPIIVPRRQAFDSPTARKS